jgi:hypothetical protein
VRQIRPAVIRAAESDVDNARQQLRAHAKQCGICAAALRCHVPGRCCDSGWAHAKYIRRMEAQQRATEADHAAAAPVQLGLF